MYLDGLAWFVLADWNYVITSYSVQRGCCAFYRHGNCQNFMFSATNRYHGKLLKHDNDAISSYRCGPDCNGN
jgi:hypothetical protein